MRAIDTNVAARLLLQDDPDQYRIARILFSEPTFIPVTVLLELGWLLGSRYRQPRHAVAGALRELVDLPSVRIADKPTLLWALDRYAEGADLADMIHVGAAHPASSFATFDRTVSAHAGATTPVPIETFA